LPSGLRLTAQPPEVDVGSDVIFTLTAHSWPAPASVQLSFVSAHHGFTGAMQWDGGCACFRLAVTLARRIHQLELATGTATVRSGGKKEVARATFLIRGLASNGRGFAPGGPPQLTSWVSDPNPFQGEYEHYCAWVRTADGLGVSGVKVRFVVHFESGTKTWVAGSTGSTGILCLHRSIGKARVGRQVTVDVYAGSLHDQTHFTPRP
jgi:hypothetical protein